MRYISLKGIELKSKFFLAPINTGFTCDGVPDDRLLKFHQLRSGKGIGISYVGNVAINKDFVTNENTAYFNDDDHLRWKQLSNIITRNGSVPGIQLGCRKSQIMPMRKNQNNDIHQYVENVKKEFLEYSHEEIDFIISEYIKASKFSWDNGFKAIQIHAAHGYFLSISLSKSLNIRNDIYGNRTLILSRIIEGIKEIIPNCILDVRISILEGIVADEIEYADKEEILEYLVKSKVDIISLSNGIYNINKYLIYPKLENGHCLYEDYAIAYAIKYPKVIWNVAGNIYDLSRLRGLNLDNLTYSICRSLIADHEFVIKFYSLKESSIISCKRCNRCHYYTNSEKDLRGCLYLET